MQSRLCSCRRICYAQVAEIDAWGCMDSIGCNCGCMCVQASGDMLDDGKYQCNIKDELAQKLAHNLQISLDSYLLYV